MNFFYKYICNLLTFEQGPL